MGRLLRRLGKKPDPKVERERAISQAESRHEELVEQARALAGKLAEPEAELARALYVVEELHPSIRRGLALADQAREAGDEPEARSYEEAAGWLGDSMAAAQPALKEAKILFDAALGSVEAAQRAVRESAVRLEELRGEVGEEERLPRSEDAQPSVEVEGLREEADARYERAVHGAEAAHAALRQRATEREQAGADDSPGESGTQASP